MVQRRIRVATPRAVFGCDDGFTTVTLSKYLLVVIYAWCTHVRTVESIGHAV